MNSVVGTVILTGALAAQAQAGAPTEPDPFLEAERQEQADLERLRTVNSGTLQFLDQPAPANELHTRMALTISADSLDSGWVLMRQCQSGLDAMSVSEIVYRYAAMEDLHITSTRNIDSAVVDGPSVQLRGVRAGAEICVTARVKTLHALGEGRYRIISGPYHRRFFDGYFPMTLSLDVHYPAALVWRTARPPMQRGFKVQSAPGRVTVDTRFAGMLTVTLEFAASE